MTEGQGVGSGGRQRGGALWEGRGGRHGCEVMALTHQAFYLADRFCRAKTSVVNIVLIVLTAVPRGRGNGGGSSATAYEAIAVSPERCFLGVFQALAQTPHGHVHYSTLSPCSTGALACWPWCIQAPIHTLTACHQATLARKRPCTLCTRY